MREKHEQLDVLRTLVGHLSPRERQVFERVVRGKMNKEIARELGSTERTIKAHRQRVMEKIHVTSLAELAMIAERIGIFASEMPRHMPASNAVKDPAGTTTAAPINVILPEGVQPQKVN